MSIVTTNLIPAAYGLFLQSAVVLAWWNFIFIFNYHKFLCCQVIQEESKMLPYFVIVIDVPLEAKYKHLATTQGFTQGWVVSRKLDDFHALHQRLIQVLNMHDDIIKWKHFPRYWPFVRGIHRSPVNSLHKGQWHGAFDVFFDLRWINGWVNSHEAGDLGCRRAHYDTTVMDGWSHCGLVMLICVRKIG